MIASGHRLNVEVLHTLFSWPGTINPVGCYMYISLSNLPFKNAILTSIWCNSRSKYARMDNNMQTKVNRTIEQKFLQSQCLPAIYNSWQPGRLYIFQLSHLTIFGVQNPFVSYSLKSLRKINQSPNFINLHWLHFLFHYLILLITSWLDNVSLIVFGSSFSGHWTISSFALEALKLVSISKWRQGIGVRSLWHNGPSWGSRIFFLLQIEWNSSWSSSTCRIGCIGAMIVLDSLISKNLNLE